MDAKDKDKLIEHYVTEKIQGRDLSKIRKEMLQNGLPEADVNTLIRKIDEKVLLHELDKTKAKINKQILYLGATIIIVSLIMLFASRTQIFVIKRDLAISAILIVVGVTMVVYSLIFSQKPRIKR